MPEGQRSRFAALLRDDELGDSWLRVVSNDEIPAGEVSEAIDQTDEVSDFGRVTEFKTGSEVQDAEYPDNYDQVHTPNSIVTEYEVTEETNFYRLYTEGENRPYGRFTMRSESDIRELSPEEIQRLYAIPDEPPDTIAVGEVPEGITMRVGEVADNPHGPGGRTQYTIPQSSVSDSDTLVPWFEHSDELTEALIT